MNEKHHESVDLGTASEVINYSGWSSYADGTSGVTRRSGTSSSSRVLCTELYHQGKLPADILKANVEHFWHFGDSHAAKAYHFWAIPYVNLMRRKDVVGRVATTVVKPFATAWAMHTAYVMGARDKDHLGGRILTSVMMPLHKVLGRIFWSTSGSGYIQSLAKAQN